MKEEQLHRGEIPQGYMLNENSIQGGTYLTPENAIHPSIEFAPLSNPEPLYRRRRTDYYDRSPRRQDPGDVAPFQTSDFESQRPVALEEKQSSYDAQDGTRPQSQEYDELPVAPTWNDAPEPIDAYGGGSNDFPNSEEARRFRDAVDEFVKLAAAKDPSFPRTVEEERAYVRKMTSCLLDVQIFEDRKQKNGNVSSNVVPFITDNPKARISRRTAEATAWRALDTAKDVHLIGAIKYPKDKVEKFEPDYTFAERIHEISNLFRRFKSQCTKLINDGVVIKLVLAPKEQLGSCRGNIKNNGNKTVMLDVAKSLINHTGTTEEKAAMIEGIAAENNSKTAAGGRPSDKKRKRAANDENDTKEAQPARRTRKTKKTPVVSNKSIPSSVPTSATKRRRTSPQRTQQMHHHPGFAPSPHPSQQYAHEHHIASQHLHPNSTYPSTPHAHYTEQYTYAQEPQYAPNPHQQYQQEPQYLSARYAVQPVDHSHGHGLPSQHPSTPSNTSTRTPFDTPLAPDNHHAHGHVQAPQFFTPGYGAYPLTEQPMHGLPTGQENIDPGDPGFSFEEFVHEGGSAAYGDGWDAMRSDEGT